MFISSSLWTVVTLFKENMESWWCWSFAVAGATKEPCVSVLRQGICVGS